MKRVLAITTVLSLAYSVTQVSTSEQKRLIGLKVSCGAPACNVGKSSSFALWTRLWGKTGFLW